MEKVRNDTKLIAGFLGYVYHEPKVLIDNSECGGLYEEVEVFSKVPILVNRYDNGQIYFAKVPNPDFGNKNNPHWNPNIKTLSWEILNSDHHILLHEIDYSESLDQLIPVIKKVFKIFNSSKALKDTNPQKYCKYTELVKNIQDNLLELNIGGVHDQVVEFIEEYNRK